jgi:hypothetical protein
MSGNPNQSSQPTPDSPGHDSIWRGSPSRRESAASWESMMEVLSLYSAPPEERTPSRHLPSGAQQQPSGGALTSSWQILPVQQQQPTLRQQTASGQPFFEEPPRPPTRRSNQDDSTQPRMITPATQPFLRQTLQPRNITTPHPQLLPPLAGYIAAYLAIYEGHPRRTDPLNLTRPFRRNSSIIVQTNAHSDKFREFCCIATPQRWPKRHVQFYSSPEMPDPRWTAPGLLAMQFIAWVPHGQIAELDKYMKTWRRRVDNSWTHTTWIGLYLESLVQQGLISQGQMERTMIFQEQAFRIPYTEALPNDRQCFPQLY